ncbi:MAG: hypothetical protein ED557_10075 [Balneola sp.]|nr:MAG: hypothetical protein ED557_10075 [Balneola sp.]
MKAKRVTWVVLFFKLICFFNISAQGTKISYNGENTFYISSSLYSELKVNGKISFEDILQEGSWNLLIKEFGEPENTDLVSDSLFGKSRSDDFDGLRIYYSEIEDPGKLLANRVEIDSTSFSLIANDFELSIRKPINDLFPAELKNKLSGKNRLVLFIEYEENKYADIETIGLEIDPYTGIIKSMLIILWRP